MLTPNQTLYKKSLNTSGHAKYMQVRFDDAVTDYDEALVLDPDLAVAYFNRGTIKYRMGKHEEAAKDLQVAVDKEPDNGEFKEGLKNCQEQAKSS